MIFQVFITENFCSALPGECATMSQVKLFAFVWAKQNRKPSNLDVCSRLGYCMLFPKRLISDGKISWLGDLSGQLKGKRLRLFSLTAPPLRVDLGFWLALQTGRPANKESHVCKLFTCYLRVVQSNQSYCLMTRKECHAHRHKSCAWPLHIVCHGE
jgi:hypothetical protein